MKRDFSNKHGDHRAFNMASGGVLPTYQRYVNGVPITQTRKTLKLREKYIVLLVFVTFSTVCFGAFFFLPDLRDSVNVRDIRQQFNQHGEDVFIPRADAPGIVNHNPGDADDPHKRDDKTALRDKIKNGLDDVRKQLNISKNEHDAHREDIQDAKNKILEKQKEEEALKEKKRLEDLAKEIQDHEPHKPGVNPIPPGDTKHDDEENQKRRETVVEVGYLYNALYYVYSCTVFG